jgi:hypothetical protein
MSISRIIYQHIVKIPLGKPFSSTRLLNLGSRAVVDQALSRLVKAGKITRITRGVYVRPRHSKYVEQVLPEPFKIAEAKVESTGARVAIHGAEAARVLGLSTQMQTQPVFYTTGPSGKFKVGKMTVRLKHISPRKLEHANNKIGVVISALWYLGKEEVTPEIIASIKKQLKPKEFEKLKSSVQSMPIWMANALRSYEQQVKHA